MNAITSLGILDFGGRRAGRPSWTAVNETVSAAQLADRLGYRRYWLAEHQAIGDGWGAATVMVGHLAMQTRQINVGTAGSLINYHDLFDLASDYRLLEAIHPGRIDLGIAGGGPTMTGLHVRYPKPDYLANIAALVELLRRLPKDVQPDQPPLVPIPADVTISMPWLLGSGMRSKDAAVRHRTAFCYSLFHSPRIDPDIVADYLDRFAPSADTPRPRAAICASVICAETEAEARHIEATQAHHLRARGATLNVVGSAPQCAERLQELAERFGVSEVVVHDVSCTVPERRRCYALLAQELLRPRDAVDGLEKVG